MSAEEVIEWVKKVNEEFGRRPLKHNSVKVVSERKSIQGMWHNTLWNQFPKHMLESQREQPGRILEPVPPRPRLDKKQRPHAQTAIARKKYALVD